MASRAKTDRLALIFRGLRDKNDENRLQSAQQLRDLVASAVSELPPGEAAEFWKNVTPRIFELIHSAYAHERLGGVTAIDLLLDVEFDEVIESRRGALFRFYGYIRQLLPSPDVNVMVAAAKTLGRIAEISGNALGDHFIDVEIPKAIGLLQTDKDTSKHAAVLIMRELAMNSPGQFHTHVGLVLDKIWTPLRDSRVIVREGAAELLATCFDIVSNRERSLKVPIYARILQEAQAGFKIGTVDAIHGSLLSYRELLLHAGMFMRESFIDTCELVLRFKEHKDPLIRRTVITMIPTLAVYDTQIFSEHFLHKAMGHLLPQLKKPSERSIAFTAIGYVAIAVGSEMKGFLEPIMASIKEILSMRGKKNAPGEEPIFQCVAMLAEAVGLSLTKLLHDQLDLMFACGLSEPLRAALEAIAKYILPLLKTIQERLLDMLSIILSGQSYKPLGAPGAVRADIVNRDVVNAQPKTPELITLALKTLGSFDFTGYVLNEFVRDCALPYLEDDNAIVRHAAAYACCHLFVRDPICYQASNHSIEIVSDVLDKLLTVGIADPDPAIRHTVLSNLDQSFDRHLSQAENVRSLFVALNDEVFTNREAAITVIGRLATHNPAYVMPSLRKALIQLLTELEYSTVIRNKEESAKLLTLLVSATQRLIKPYVLPMLKVLLPKASDSNAAIASNVMACLGQLARVGGEDINQHVPDMMKLVIETLRDPSLMKRDAALQTLGLLCSNTGYVIEPLVEYPELLGILTRILKTEQSQGVRRETIKVMGILGALDPYKHQIKIPDDVTNEPAKAASSTDVILAMNTSGPSSEEYYQAVVVNALLNILKDPSLIGIHHSAIEAIMSIFKTQGLRCVTFLPQVIPAFFAVIRTATTRVQDVIQHLIILVSIIKQHIRNYLPDAFALIQELWVAHPSLEVSIVALVESLSKALHAEFRPFLPTVLPPMLKVFDAELSDKREQTQVKVFHALFAFGSNIEEYMHLIIPIIVKTIEKTDASSLLRITAVKCIDGLSRKVNFSDHASRIIHPLVRVLSDPNSTPELRNVVMDTLCALLIQLGSDFAIFAPMINKCLVKGRITHAKYDLFVSRLLNGERLPTEFGAPDPWDQARFELGASTENARMIVNQQHLKQAWDVSQVATREDWLEWIRKLTVEFMKESPSHAVRACKALADTHLPLSRELFNAAFISCWPQLYEHYQEDLVRSIEHAITAPSVPPELIHILLNLAEFMEHDDKPFPIDIRTLGEYALRCHAYAKALHYKELEFFSEMSSPSIIEALININTKLQQHDAAFGALTLARDQLEVFNHEEWYEKLGKWQEALQAYNGKLETSTPTSELVIGKMRCLHALGEWELLSDAVQEKWVNATHEERGQIAPLAAAAAWSLNQWDMMDDYIAVMKQDSPDRPFYRAILSVHRNQFPKALQQINRARDLLDPELTALVGESYRRAYNVVVRVQMLSELEEIIMHKQMGDQPDRQTTIRNTWMKRLQGCQPDVEVWQRILQVRTLVMSPDEDATMWIKFANLCRKSDRMFLAEKTLNSLFGPSVDDDRNVRGTPAVIYAHLKFMWAHGEHRKSFDFLRSFTSSLTADLGFNQIEPSRLSELLTKPKMNEYTKLLARCYLKQGQWQNALKKDWDDTNIPEILHAYHMATQFDSTWYKAWHTWALANFEVIGHLESRGRMEDILPDNAVTHIVAAIRGFYRSIASRKDNPLQDTLRLLTLWFKFGADDSVSMAMADGFREVSIDTWLDVIPQIIARIQTPSSGVRRLINQLLTDVGKDHPQALIYPLTVASKSSSAARKNAASTIMDKMKEHSQVLVEQARIVSHELIRVAILWHELWHEALEEASRLYFTEKNPEAMIAVLEPLHDLLEAGPETTRETSFVQVFGRDLREAREATRKFLAYGDASEMNKAWDIYYLAFKKLEKQMSLPALDLQYVSPELLKARNLELAVPGTYHSGRAIVKISSFGPTLTVIQSKQRPRRLTLKGSDGRDYQYCLKGHEDLRQDERVMQLFGLVNALLSVDTDSFKRHLHIHRFPVIPLAPNAGLLGWVQDSDTLHVLIKDYRESRKILLNIEYRLMLQMAPDYEILTLMQKVEVFEHALDNTTGQDLYRVLWLKSANSEAWLERRTNYTRSLAVTSMVGYILGLGDRHPSNLLLDRASGKLIHIDFGDCFEVAMHREKYPEKVPFRLTRMLTHAMEVSGIGGSYSTTCRITMQVLRDNKESLMAVLEAFVYDPLINWRLLQTDTQANEAVEETKKGGYGQGPNRKVKADENEIFNEATGVPGVKHEVRNDRALAVYNRVQNKLTGRDFDPNVVLPVAAQVEKLIAQATSCENLCQCFSGWCAFW